RWRRKPTPKASTLTGTTTASSCACRCPRASSLTKGSAATTSGRARQCTRQIPDRTTPAVSSRWGDFTPVIRQGQPLCSAQEPGQGPEWYNVTKLPTTRLEPAEKSAIRLACQRNCCLYTDHASPPKRWRPPPPP